jgi:Uma2 family endonuclease
MATAEMPRTTESSVDADALFEVIDGEIVEKQMGILETRIATRLVTLLETHCAANGLGMAFCETMFRTKRFTNQKRRPDVAFLSRERWPLDRPIPEAEAFDLAPDLAIEVVSPSDLASSLQEKIEEYFEAGVKQVWLIYRTTATIEVRDTPGTARILHRGDILDGGAILPGFQLAVADLLPEPKADVAPVSDS